MPNPYRDLMNQGRVASGEPGKKTVTKPRMGGMPPRPKGSSMGDLTSDPPIQHNPGYGLKDVEDTGADTVPDVLQAAAAASAAKATPTPAPTLIELNAIERLKKLGLGPDGEPLSPEPASLPK